MKGDEAKEIEKLLEKAELTRYMHAGIGERRGLQSKVIQSTVGLLGMLVSISAAVYYRSSKVQDATNGWGFDEAILLALIVLPLVATTLVILDGTVWRLRDREEEHKKASGIWGEWIRRTRESSVTDGRSTEFLAVQKRYRKCMKTTPNTSMRKFLKYKREWIRYKNESVNLDQRKSWRRLPRNKREDGQDREPK